MGTQQRDSDDRGKVEEGWGEEEGAELGGGSVRDCHGWRLD